ncbi:ribonuclease E inhibitor RraB [Fictibacillus sp. UD]|uniref:ribonuclease E inhibitor RraB n=1 Tax=Fictibacillus sp. UD TaxID=3038777 RepID=UPI003744BC1D
MDELKSFEQDIQKEGFKTENLEQEKNEDGTYSITISREDGVDYPLIDDVTDLIIEIAQNHNGEYDGWESPVILSKRG